MLERSIGHDYLVVLISDFHGWNDAALKTICRINQHNDIICALVFDPLERDISGASKLVVSDGKFQLEIEPDRRGPGQEIRREFCKLRGLRAGGAEAPQCPGRASGHRDPGQPPVAGKAGRPASTAMSAPPLPDAFGNYALGEFVEVVPPPDISWWPQTTGWWWLGAVLAGFALHRGWKLLRHWYRNRYRREAAGRLQRLAGSGAAPAW